MDFQRRQGLLAAAALLAVGASSTARAQGAFPNRPVKIVVPFLAGGSVDPVARLLGEKLSAIWGQAVIVDNKPGASTIIGTDAVAKAAPDGYTILLTANTHVSNPMLFNNLPFDSIADFTPIVPVNTAEFVLTTYPSFKANTLREAVAEIKANPGKFTYASAGVGNIVHLGMELFQMLTGTKLLHVPYKGANQILPDLVSGQVQFYLSVPVTVIPYLQSGKIKALATTARLPAMPTVPTFAEAGMPEFTLRSWLGFLAPAKTPRDIVNKLNADISRVLQMPDVREKLISQGQNPWILSPEEFGAAMRKDAAEYARVIKAANIKLE
ncbi:MAG: tripartite tricarboxylate transporter substrate binding protein [Pseudomonadota bacterium]